MFGIADMGRRKHTIKDTESRRAKKGDDAEGKPSLLSHPIYILTYSYDWQDCLALLHGVTGVHPVPCTIISTRITTSQADLPHAHHDVPADDNSVMLRAAIQALVILVLHDHTTNGRVDPLERRRRHHKLLRRAP
jgi:hypothetical protein